MKDILMTVLRNRDTPTEQFRQATEQLATLLAIEASHHIPRAACSVKTPLEKTKGASFKYTPLLVPILRAGLALLPSFVRFHPSAAIGFVGVQRDEKTALPQLYYARLPSITPHSPIFILDPMLATGGSSSLATEVLISSGALEEQITLISFIASPEGLAFFQEKHPKAKIITAQVDKELNKHKFIVPGLGDFGDRYFGTVF